MNQICVCVCVCVVHNSRAATSCCVSVCVCASNLAHLISIILHSGSARIQSSGTIMMVNYDEHSFAIVYCNLPRLK